MMLMFALACAVGCLAASRGLIHFFQLESYQFPGYYRTVKRNLVRCLLPGAILAAYGLFMCLIGSGRELRFSDIFFAVAYVCWGVVIHQYMKKQKAKKALVFTPA